MIGVGENFFLNGGIFYDDVLKKLPSPRDRPYLIIVADAADAVSVNFSGRCKFLQI